MRKAKKPLLELTAADLMTREVVAVSSGTTMRVCQGGGGAGAGGDRWAWRGKEDGGEGA
jgi:hypothetical protein